MTAQTPAKQARSLYLSVIGAVVRIIDRYASPAAWIRWAYHRCWPNDETPLWLAEFYQLAWILVLSTLLLKGQHFGASRYIATGLVGWRLVDILANVLNGIFFEGEGREPRRNVLILLGNMLEVALGASVLLIDAKCASGFEAFYSAVRTLATIGPSDGVDKEPICQAIATGEVATNFVLVLLIFTLVVSRLNRTKETD